jgi:hypothetical protein
VRSPQSTEPIFVTAWSRSSACRSLRTIAATVREAVIGLIAALNRSRHGAGGRFCALIRRKRSTYGVEHAGR